MSERRADGELEGDVLGVLWEADEPLTPSEVNDRLAAGLAYTTVMTVLTRLWTKGLLERTRRGRAYAYRARISESDLATRRLTETLSGVSNRSEVLARFVVGLPTREKTALRRLLDDGGGER